MKVSVLTLLLIAALFLGLSLAIRAEDEPNTSYDESEARLYDISLVSSIEVLAQPAPPLQGLRANPVHDANELVAEHLNSIASSTIRAGLKSRVVEGLVHFAILVGGAGKVNGKAFLVSEGEKLQFMMKLPSNDYRGEQFVFDGKKHKIAFGTPQQTRSPFGKFLFERDQVIREGLLGGTLSTAWPLLNLNERKAKLSFNGLKKIDGQQLYELRYHPRRSSELEIKLYFDPETYRHVETIYVYTISERMVEGGPTAQAEQLQSRYRLQEKFSDFKTVDGFTLPARDEIQLLQVPQSGGTIVYEWDLSDLEVWNNRPVDSRNFDVN